MQGTLLTRETIREQDIQRVLDEPLPWDRFKDCSFLVTGAYGMLALPMIEVLLALESGVKVYGLVRNREKASRKLPHLLNNPNFQLLLQDVTDPIAVNAPIDYIVHAASPASPKYYLANPVDTILPNVLGTKQLLSLATQKQCKGFLYVSSGEVYGQLPHENDPVTEERFGAIDPLSPRACYAESKRLGETLCSSWARQYGLPVTIVRPFHTFGPWMDLEDGRVFADFVSNTVKGQDIVLKSDGSAQRAYCYVSDAVAAIFTAWLVGTPGEAYNIGNDNGVLSVKELGELLLRLSPEKKRQLKFDVQPIPDSNRAATVSVPDLAKIKDLGWQARVKVETGFLNVIRGFACEETN